MEYSTRHSIQMEIAALLGYKHALTKIQAWFTDKIADKADTLQVDETAREMVAVIRSQTSCMAEIISPVNSPYMVRLTSCFGEDLSYIIRIYTQPRYDNYSYYCKRAVYENVTLVEIEDGIKELTERITILESLLKKD